jgi:hypothetical protein
MKFLFSISLLFSGLSVYAATVEIEGKAFDCAKKSETAFHCEDGANKILVVKNFLGYAAILKEGDNLPAMKWVEKVTEGDKVLFEIPKVSFSGMSNNIIQKRNTRSDRIADAMGIIANLKDMNDDFAKEFVSEARAYVNKEKQAKNKVKMTVDDRQFDCKRGQDRPLTEVETKTETLYNIKLQCNFYVCTDQIGRKVLSYVPSLGSYDSPYFLDLNKEKTELRFDGLKISDESKEDAPLFNIPKVDGTSWKYANSDENLLVPSKFDKNKNAFYFFTDPATSTMREGTKNLCGGDDEVKNLLAEEKKIIDIFQDELVKTNLTHYLTLLDGKLFSIYIDAAKAVGLGCSYDNMILSSEAAKHLEWLQKANKKSEEKYLSEEEVQELFIKAKNMPDIPFGYKYDGCYARAHVMARRFEALGIPTQKVWIKGDLYVPGTDIRWNYHVAPVVLVKMKNGEIKKYAIDPSLNDKAVTVDGWVESMGKRVKGGVVQTQYPFPENVSSFQRTAVAFSSSDIYIPDYDEIRTEDKNMALAIKTMKEYSEALKGN